MEKIVRSLQALKLHSQSASGLFRPDFFRLVDSDSVQRFEQLLNKPGIQAVDQIHDQLRELIKIRFPEMNFSKEELDARVASHLGTADPVRYGVWVYYPWSNRLVHILDKDEFIDVRTSRNQYKITPAERDTLASKKIGVIGLSVGQSVSVTLAMERICGEIRLADFDLLELTNLNRIRTGVHNLGLAKVYSVAREISEIDPYIDVICFPEGLTEKNLDDFFLRGGKLDLVVEESDGFDIKILSRYKARELKVPVIMEASDRCMVDVERFDLEPDRPILHGIVKELDVTKLKTLTTNEEKIPYMLDILGFEKTTPRLRASMLEMKQTIGTWPQLASAVVMGGGIAADVSRRMLLGHFSDSGRYYVDIEQLIGNKKIKKADTLQPVKRLQDNEAVSLGKHAGTGVKGEKLSDSQVREIVLAASFAPSFANVQPWKWLQAGNILLLIDDLPAYDFSGDPDKINKMISFGAVLETVRIKAASMGYKLVEELYPSADEKLIASLQFEKGGTDKEELSPQIEKRRTNRGAGTGKPVEKHTIDFLKEAFSDPDGSSLHITDNKEKISALARAAGESERFRLTDTRFNMEFFGKILNNSLSDAGIPVKAMAWPPAVELAMQVASDPSVAGLLGEWRLGKAFSKYTEALVNSSPAIGFVAVSSTDRKQLLKAGMAIQRAWLTATRAGLAFHPLSLPLLLAAHSSQLPADKKSYFECVKEQLSLIFSGVDATNVIFLFRILQAGQPSASPRRSLDEILLKVN